MIKIPNILKPGQDRYVSWNLIFVVCTLVIISQLSILTKAIDFSLSNKMIVARGTHLALGIIVLIYIFFKKKNWNSEFANVLFVILYIPFYYLSWHLNVEAAASTQLWIPFQNLHFHLFALVILVPGSYLINFILIVGFAIEALILWLYLDLPHLPNVILFTEPIFTFLYVVVAIALLWFRYRDEQTIQRLSLEHAKAEVLETLARIFLSIRDKSNTPLQTLKISIDLLKMKRPLDDHTISVLENSVNRLSFLSDILKMSEEKMEFNGEELMTDEEILQWIKR